MLLDFGMFPCLSLQPVQQCLHLWRLALLPKVTAQMRVQPAGQTRHSLEIVLLIGYSMYSPLAISGRLASSTTS
jgi:hypothetical protein